jgi:tetratricopeptide (TPR) repeat protein
VVDAATAAEDFARAASYLSTFLQVEDAHRDSLLKMAQVREAEGNATEAARSRLALAREDERRGNLASAIENYRLAAAAAPEHPEAAARLAELSRTAEASGSAPSAKEPPEIVVDLEEALPEPAATAPPVAGAAPAFVASGSPEERELDALIVEAEIFARYGLTDKAVERLRVVVRKRPELVSARERLLELMAASSNPALAQETESFADFYRQRGESDRAEATLARLGLSAPRAAASIPTPAESFEEFPVEPRPAPTGDFLEDFGSESLAFEPEAPAAPPASSTAGRETPLPSLQASQSGPVSYGRLDALLGEEMRKAGDAPSPPSAPAPSLDEQSLFAEEQQFFNLADELEKELAEQAPVTNAPAIGPEGEASLEEIFREFKKGVEQQLSAEDYETHSNLGIAYKEMGLIDEAIAEFQLASKDPGRAVECCSMLGLCFLEKGMPQLAIKWYRKGLEARDIKEAETMGLLYDLAGVYQSTGDMDNAYRTFLDVYGLDAGFRDVAEKVRELEAVKKN